MQVIKYLYQKIQLTSSISNSDVPTCENEKVGDSRVKGEANVNTKYICSS